MEEREPESKDEVELLWRCHLRRWELTFVLGGGDLVRRETWWCESVLQIRKAQG